MTWARLDDQFYANDKVLTMSHGTFRLFVVSIVYCRSQKDDYGFVSLAASKSLCGMHGVSQKCRAELQNLGCWEPVNGGWLIHDYDKYVEKSSTERVRKHRERKRDETLHGRFNGVSLSRAQGPDPVPVPEPVRENREENAGVFNNIADVVEMTRRAASREVDAA